MTTRRALTALTAASTKELLRDRKTLFFAAVFPLCLLAVFLGSDALTPDGPGLDRTRFLLGTGLFVALASVAFYGVAVPLLTLRERGTLRLLSTTPVSPLTVLVAQAPVRLAIALGQAAVIAVLSAVLGYLPADRLPALLVTSLAGLALLIPVGFLLGSVLPSAEAAGNALTFALLALLGAAGLFQPLDTLPDGVRDALTVLPPGLLGGAIQDTLTGVPTPHPLWLAWLACGAAGVVLTLAAVGVFRWDRSER